MATLTEVLRPYEFLVRWDTKTGLLKASHVGYSTVLLRDGVFASEVVEPVRPVDTPGFPLADILQQIQIDSLVLVDNTKKDMMAKEELHTAAISAKDVELAAIILDDKSITEMRGKLIAKFKTDPAFEVKVTAIIDDNKKARDKVKP